VSDVAVNNECTSERARSRGRCDQVTTAFHQARTHIRVGKDSLKDDGRRLHGFEREQVQHTQREETAHKTERHVYGGQRERKAEAYVLVEILVQQQSKNVGNVPEEEEGNLHEVRFASVATHERNPPRVQPHTNTCRPERGNGGERDTSEHSKRPYWSDSESRTTTYQANT
jgi:hypothetical protein